MNEHGAEVTMDLAAFTEFDLVKMIWSLPWVRERPAETPDSGGPMALSNVAIAVEPESPSPTRSTGTQALDGRTVFGEIWRRHGSWIDRRTEHRAWCRRPKYVPGDEFALCCKEAARELVMRKLRIPGGYAGGVFRAYISTIVETAVWHEVRKAGIRKPNGTVEPRPDSVSMPEDGADRWRDSGTSPEQQLLTNERTRALLSCLEALASTLPLRASAVRLHIYSEMSSSEIAARMGIETDSARAHIRRALPFLKTCLAARGITDL